MWETLSSVRCDREETADRFGTRRRRIRCWPEEEEEEEEELNPPHLLGLHGLTVDRGQFVDILI